MKLKIFSVVATVFIGILLSSSLTYAQQTTRTDTAYVKKMQKLQEQMRTLQKQMTELRVDESKKYYADSSARNADRAKRNAERVARNAENVQRTNERIAENMRQMNERIAESVKRSNEKFEKTFSNFSSSFRFNFSSNDSSLQRKVKSGEVKEKNKSFSKSYNVTAGDKLQIDNRYGKVIVNTWEKNEFKVDVQIKAYANDDAAAQKLLDKTSITDSKESDLVSYKTVIDNTDENGNSFWGTSTSNGKTTVRQIVINYTVYMPAKNALEINNRYGGVELPNLEGKVLINNSYGGLIAKSLNNSEDKVSVKYGNAKITSFGGNQLDIAYGDLSLDAGDKLNATIRYGSAKIGKLNTSGTIDLHYGNGLEIVDIDKNIKSLSINSSYAPVRLNGITGVNADFDVTVRYASFLYDANAINITNKTPATNQRYSSTQNYKGHIGKGSQDKVININSNSGSVTFH